MSGMKIVVVDNKRQYGASLDEGKEAMSFEVYKKLCEELYNGKFDDHVFAHSFLKMEWDLMARSNNCVNIRVRHIQLRLDCLIFYFGTLKVNQPGGIANDPWRVYSNPKNPTFFTVIALSK